ncbi:MAG: ABC transporter ATP-binding protein [Tissierellia bacterium]|nr:ABC transporter ATP-binding protein [Tissierellia bacterium]
MNKKFYKDSIKIMAKTTPWEFGFLCLWNTLRLLVPLLGIYVGALLFGEVEAVAKGGVFHREKIYVYALYLLLASAYTIYYGRYHSAFRAIPRLELRLRKELQAKVNDISNHTLEDPMIHRSLQGAVFASTNIYRLVQSTMDLFFVILSALLTGTVISLVHPLYLFLLLLGLFPMVLEIHLQNTLKKRSRDALVQWNREEKAYEKALHGREAAMETRLIGARNFYEEKYFSSRQQKHDRLQKDRNLLLRWKLFLLPMTILGEIGAYGLSALLLAKGVIGFEVFGAGLAAFMAMQAMTREVFSLWGYANQFNHMVEPYFTFMSREDRRGEREFSPGAIRLEGVSFRYPTGKDWAVEDVDFQIQPGEVIAIVGENGSGKTTLTKLITGEYVPTKGRVFHGTKTSGEISEEVLYNHCSSVLQKFMGYALTFKENIFFGREGDAEALRCRLLPQREDIKEDTLLGKEFGGMELSGGQWQRIAIARGIGKGGTLLLLDEPTSAIDPIHEMELLHLFQEEIGGKTAVLVTHRMGMISLADRILVMEKGRIVEEGSHEDLMKKEGIYSTMYRAQADLFD